jgi:hypothetical protein
MARIAHMERDMKDQQLPPRHEQAQPPDPPASDRDSAAREPTAQEMVPSPVPASPSWRSSLSRLAAHPQLTRRRLVVAVVVVGVLAFLFGMRSPSPSPSPTAPDTHLFSVTERPMLIFKHFIANVNITPGPDGQVSIQEIKNGATDAIAIHYAQQGNTITVTVDIPGGLMEDTWVDFAVKVPARAGLTTTVATGTLEATDLGGPIMLNNTNGAIWATNLTGSIGLKTQSGSINLTKVSGQVAVATQNGTVTTTATRLDGRSSIRAKSGTINFHGSLSPTGTYQFQNSNGAVGITLPPSSTFTLVARSIGGSINSDFQGVTVSQANGRTEARGAIGAAARAHLIIETTGGSIDLHRGE